MVATKNAAAGPSRVAETPAPAPDDDGTQLTYNETVEALCSFIKTAVHTILCHRQLYPPNVFSRKQRYRVPVWASRHPGLNAYIDDVLAAIKTQIQRSLVRSVQMVLTMASTAEVIERYRFDIDFILQDVAMRDRDFSIPGNMTMQSMELQLRAFMMKLISIDGALYDIDDPEGVTWALVLDMKDGCQPQTSDAHGSEPQQGLWVPFESGPGANDKHEARNDDERPAYLRASRRAQDDDAVDDALIVPIKSLDTGVINLMLYVEEHPSAKRQASSARAATANRSLAGKDADKRRQRDRRRPDEEERYGERDIDEPLQHPSSSGAAAQMSGKKKQRKQKKAQLDGEGELSASTGAAALSEGESDSNDSRGSSGSADSIRSVNDFAGYGKGPGGVGMSGVGM